MPGPAQTPSKPQYRSPLKPLEGLRCNCPDFAVRQISRSVQNPDRPFWCCRRDRGDPNHCKFFKWEDGISATPTSRGGLDSNKRPRSPSSARQESPRKRAILDTLLSEELTPPKPKASQTSFEALLGNLGDTNDDDDDEFNNTQAFKFNPLGGKGRSQVSPLSAPALSTPRTTSGLAFNTPPGSALLFDPLESPTQKSHDIACANASGWSPSSLLECGLSQETDADEIAVYINAIKKLEELPVHLRKLQGRVTEAQTAKKLVERKLRESEERNRALQKENEHLKARQGL